MSSEKRYIFICPGCSEEIRVDEEMKNKLIENGCVICGSDLESSDFLSE